MSVLGEISPFPVCTLNGRNALISGHNFEIVPNHDLCSRPAHHVSVRKKSARISTGYWGGDAYDPGKLDAFAPPDDDVEIASAVLVAKPINQMVERRLDSQGWLALLAVAHAIDVGAKPGIGVIQEVPKQCFQSVIF
jgi:hypothetical protein